MFRINKKREVIESLNNLSLIYKKYNLPGYSEALAI